MKITKEIIWQTILFTILGLLFNSLELISIRKICYYPEHGPYFYGFPMIHRTNMTWVNTGSGTIYLLGLIVNGLFWGLILYGLKRITTKLTSNRISKYLLSAMAIISLIYFILIQNVYELKFEFNHTVKMDYYHQEIECDKTIKILNLWTDEFQSKTNQN